MRGFPHEEPPAGWYQIGWSDDFPVGEVRPLHLFGADLVAYRGEQGVTVLDAHCPHMGAHLGHGGIVEGDDIVCPFHGWVWSPEGRNVSIPDGSPPNRAQRLGCWHVEENAQIVLLWFHPRREEPTWTVPKLVDDEAAFHPIGPGRRCWTVRVHPQVVAENAIDSAHFTWVHRAASAPTIVGMEDRGPVLHVSQEMEFGGARKKTWLTPDGPIKGSLEIDLFGLGLARTRFAGADEACTLVAPTPIDGTTCEYRMTNWVPRTPGEDELTDRARRRIDEQFKQAERDFVIWEHMRYVERPPLSRTEVKPHKAFSRWAERFYVAASSGEMGDART